jgi:hypothetical protein
MKGLVLAAVLAVGAVVALQGEEDTAALSQDSEWQQRLDRFDALLANGLSQGTHDQLAVTADASANWLRGFGESFVSEASR